MILITAHAENPKAGKKRELLIPAERIERAILLIRGQKVMLDADLAAMYGVTTGNLNKFVRLRKMLASHPDLARRLDELERKYDQQFAVVFQAIRELMKPPTAKPNEIGYHTLAEQK